MHVRVNKVLWKSSYCCNMRKGKKYVGLQYYLNRFSEGSFTKYSGTSTIQTKKLHIE